MKELLFLPSLRIMRFSFFLSFLWGLSIVGSHPMITIYDLYFLISTMFILQVIYLCIIQLTYVHITVSLQLLIFIALSVTWTTVGKWPVLLPDGLTNQATTTSLFLSFFRIRREGIKELILRHCGELNSTHPGKLRQLHIVHCSSYKFEGSVAAMHEPH